MALMTDEYFLVWSGGLGVIITGWDLIWWRYGPNYQGNVMTPEMNITIVW